MSSSKSRPAKGRALTASQVAKHTHNFNRWAAFQNRGAGSISDLPAELRTHVDGVLDVFERLPQRWLGKGRLSRSLCRVVSPDFAEFLAAAQASEARLFSRQVLHESDPELLSDLQVVFAAHRRAKAMKVSGRSFSEADYAHQVYNPLRVAAMRASDCRVQCSISLPQPLPEHHSDSRAAPIVNAKTARPDGILFVPVPQLSELCLEEESAYNYLAREHGSNKSGSVGGRSSFKSQATLCKTLPSSPCFEIASTIWEDKKPAQGSLDTAQRQNSMSTTAALRQLHYLHIKSPVFGLVFAEGLVRIHVDWWKEVDGQFRIVSAPYNGPDPKSRVPYEWRLDDPADVIKLFLVMRNLDSWTVGGFCERVTEGIEDLMAHVAGHNRARPAWRRRSSVANRRLSCATSVATEAAESISTPLKPRRAAKKRSSKA